MKNYSFLLLEESLKSSTIKKLKNYFIEIIENEKKVNENITDDFVWEVFYSSKEQSFSIGNFSCSQKRINMKLKNNSSLSYSDLIKKEEESRSVVYLKFPYKLYQSLRQDFYHYDEAVFLYEDAETTIKKLNKLKKLCDKKIKEIKQDNL